MMPNAYTELDRVRDLEEALGFAALSENERVVSLAGDSLRGLAARAPYFHNGIAATLDDVLTHYEEFRNIELTQDERADLVAFLEAL